MKNEKNGEKNAAAIKAAAQKIFDPKEQIKKFGKGTMQLNTPIQDGENVYDKLHWDFTALTGAEYVNALDMDRDAANSFRITNKQAFFLFAAAAEKATNGLDAEDIRRGLSIQDAQKATQLATVFFTASSRAGDERILNE